MLRLPIIGAALLAATLFVAHASNASTSASFNIDDFDPTAIGGIETDVLEMALGAASCAVKSGVVTGPETLTVIDYSKPSSERRLWVYDLKSKRLLFEELVAHGQGSGANMATQFSNDDESHQTSLGLFVTSDTYVGKNGYSLRLDGLDEGFNDRAYDRAIVMHGAPYVNDEFARRVGRLGRSHGCPALRPEIARPLIDAIKDRSLLYVWSPVPDPAFAGATPR